MSILRRKMIVLLTIPPRKVWPGVHSVAQALMIRALTILSFFGVVAASSSAIVPSAMAQPFVEVETGTYPLILSAPHGGYLAPDSLADRTCTACVTVRDSRTQEWARALADAIETRTGKRPWVVINLLDRVKLDANRDVGEAADGDPHAAAAWATYHAALDEASEAVTSEFGGGLLLDLHGHGHSQPRFELGYLLSASRLRQSDAELNQFASLSSIRALHHRSGESFSTLVRGSESFGQLLQLVGVASTPSQADPAPLSGQAFFSGGYITARHGSRDGGTVDAIQLEAHRPGARDSQENVVALAENVADATLAYMQRWYADATWSERIPSSDGQSACLSQRGDELVLQGDCASGQVTLYDMLGRRAILLEMNPGQRTTLPVMARGVYIAQYLPHNSARSGRVSTITVLL